MGQPNEIRAFRKRLTAAGYTEIRIYQDTTQANRGRNLYSVGAIEPLSGQCIYTELTPLEMYSAFQRRDGRLTPAISAATRQAYSFRSRDTSQRVPQGTPEEGDAHGSF